MSNTTNLSHTNIIEQTRLLAKKLNTNTLSRSEFLRETGISEWQIYKYFDTWNDLVQQAGLKPDTTNRRLEDDELFSAMYDVFIEYGGIPTMTKFGKLCQYSSDVYKRRWGRWEDILVRFGEWLIENNQDFPYELPQQSPKVHEGVNIGSTSSRKLPIWQSNNQRQYGDFLNFRGLLHAPINEQGVVFLFGMIALELGYIVESVATGFPDCEAKRQIGKNRWERVSIEFEFSSKNFRSHGHDSNQCDLIICWIHDWDECPIEVLELRTAIQSLNP